MSKNNKIYICQKCDTQYLRWMGKCEGCGEWNSVVEDRGTQNEDVRIKSEGKILEPQSISNIKVEKFNKIESGISEFDRVIGGGIVSGSVILLGGDPGIGKSTLALQISNKVSNLENNKSLYISGEESAGQVKMRADRLSVNSPNLQFLSDTNIDNIIATVLSIEPRFIILDSIQTVYSNDFDSAAGSIVQVRESANRLIRCAKANNIPVILIGHITKGGEIAGPKTLEHLVDTVLYLEGDRFHNFRILRATKNRFGPTTEIGVFEMKGSGFSEIKNPSQLFLKERTLEVPGTCVAALVEGSRSFLIEIQALTSLTTFGYPKRTASGYDLNRLQLLAAVLSKRVNLKLDNQDIYINAAGGMKIKEPGADLACSLALASVYSNKIVDPKMVAIGEVGLTGEVRTVSQIDKRVSEAFNLGFEKALVPNVDVKNSKGELIKVETVREAIKKALLE
ncbi:MAG: DNA repair protein RadA [Parcubacteria group bacterium]|nr:DNA repair protein RadA [Parcubacteria group bacterium]